MAKRQFRKAELTHRDAALIARFRAELRYRATLDWWLRGMPDDEPGDLVERPPIICAR